ncbi:hypothetical protein GE09DRAFT_1024462 [Coniochaeta sp. 2T2.1]|nr:hypothetical protein GE09DRAFT_1024462 [Coniochaeta sp. 2T2.1]
MTRVLLTGGSGFIASHVLKILLERGYSVVATVRSQDKTNILKQAYPDLGPGRLNFAIVKDMAVEGAFDEVLKSDSFDAVVHTASPFHFNVTNVEKDLLNPAILGTTGILKSIKNHAPTVKRVVYTSAFAAVFNPFKGNWPEHTYTEEDWNPMTYEQSLGDPISGYTGSKLLAERAAWDFMEREKPNFTLSTLIPPFVFGPVLHGVSSFDALNTSNQFLASFILPGYREKFPFAGLYIWTDVRDLALAHVLAVEKEEAAGKRFLFVTGHFSYKQIYEAIGKNFPEFKGILEEGAKTERGDYQPDEYYKVDHTRAKEVLGVEFTKFEKSVADTIESIKEVKG